MMLRCIILLSGWQVFFWRIGRRRELRRHKQHVSFITADRMFGEDLARCAHLQVQHQRSLSTRSPTRPSLELKVFPPWPLGTGQFRLPVGCRVSVMYFTPSVVSRGLFSVARKAVTSVALAGQLPPLKPLHQTVLPPAWLEVCVGSWLRPLTGIFVYSNVYPS